MRATIPERIELSDGTSYEVGEHGVIYQILDPDFESYVYDRQYVEDRYDSLPDRGDRMSYLRSGFVIGAIGKIPESVLDIGYGNGSFLSCMNRHAVICYGLDVSGYPVPQPCLQASWSDCGRPWGLVSFFDSLEHMAEFTLVSHLRAEFVAVTAPWCHIRGWGIDWFRTWKHRRPGEHLAHFSPESLAGFLGDYHYRQIATASIEDVLRPSDDLLPNTFTSVFKHEPA